MCEDKTILLLGCFPKIMVKTISPCFYIEGTKSLLQTREDFIDLAWRFIEVSELGSNYFPDDELIPSKN
jgi:hypothetical protein